MFSVRIPCWVIILHSHIMDSTRNDGLVESLNVNGSHSLCSLLDFMQQLCSGAFYSCKILKVNETKKLSCNETCHVRILLRIWSRSQYEPKFVSMAHNHCSRKIAPQTVSSAHFFEVTAYIFKWPFLWIFFLKEQIKMIQQVIWESLPPVA